MTATETYSRLHEALSDEAASIGLTPWDVRILLALHERGGEGRTDELEGELLCCSSQIRRSSLPLRAARFITADAGKGTRAPKRGTRARLVLTAKGRVSAQRVLAAAYGELQAVAA